MGKIGCGYGSEWHLLRYMGRHREKFDQVIINEVGAGGRIEWLDFHFTGKRNNPDAELTGLEFLENAGEPSYAGVVKKWKKGFWPQTGTPPNWDAVGWLVTGDESRELILVEAKAHTGELKSNGCRAKGESKNKIEKALAKTIDYAKARTGVKDWLGDYYQYANRLATLYFLHKGKVAARLVLIYFSGDGFPKDADEGPCECPQHKDGWKKALETQDKRLGLVDPHPLTPYIHKVFLPVKAKPRHAASIP